MLTLLNQQPEREIVSGYRARFLHTNNLTLVYWSIDEGAVLPEHSHPHEQTVNILKGTFNLIVNGKEHFLSEGHVYVISSNDTHSGIAVTDCKILDVFYPIREDYIFEK